MRGAGKGRVGVLDKASEVLQVDSLLGIEGLGDGLGTVQHAFGFLVGTCIDIDRLRLLD